MSKRQFYVQKAILCPKGNCVEWFLSEQVPQQGNRSLYLPYSVPEVGQAVSKVLKLNYGYGYGYVAKFVII